MIRILHFSDVHVSVPVRHMPLLDLAGKRVLGALNLVLRRERLFRHARKKVAALTELAEREGIDLALCTGDYTALGTRVELDAARAAIEPLVKRPLGYVTVPGNHDLYVPDATRERRFEDAFGDLCTSDLPEVAVHGPFPTVRLLGDGLAIIAVTSARPNPEPWRSSGVIGTAQLDALARLLADSRVRDRFVVVATHYAPLRANGTHDSPFHGLDDADALLDILRPLRRAMLVHGHIHRRYHLHVPQSAAWIFNAGSATHEGREGCWVYELGGDAPRALPTNWDGAAWRVDAGAAVSLA